jgi:uncharacterized protein
MRVAITGATGFIGSALAREIEARGGSVTTISRSPGGPGSRVVQWDPARGSIDAAALEGHDVVVNLAGENIAGVWTPGRKRRIRDSRVLGTRLLATTLAGLGRPPAVLLSGSGMNWYADAGDRVVDEDSPHGTGFMAGVAREWEAAAQPAADAGIRVAWLRMSNVLDPAGGMLATLLPLFRLGLGTSFGSGRQYWAWITRTDAVRAILHLADREELRGPFNIAAPEPVRQAELVRAIADALNRPLLLSVPALAMRLAPGHMAEELLLPSVRMVPKRLQESGFEFREPEVREAMKRMLG